MKHVDPTHRTIYSELAQRALDARFTSDFPPDGRFLEWKRNGRSYWYFERKDETGKNVRKYVGPANDEEIARRVHEHKRLKADARQRRKLVSTLVREAYLPKPDPLVGDVVAALSEAGFFRLRGVLVGTIAYGCYPGLLGVRLPDTEQRTQDADFAQFHSISVAVGDRVRDVDEVLRNVDPTFAPVPDQIDGRRTTKFANQDGFRVEFLTPNTSSDDYGGKPATMPALGGVDATPLRFLDFLIHRPVRAVMLHRSGVPVTVPDPARYAIHKLVVAHRRRRGGDGEAKDTKDLSQAATLMEAMVELRRQDDLAEAWIEAWDRGPAWRTAIEASLGRLNPVLLENVVPALSKGLRDLDVDPGEYGFKPTPEPSRKPD